MLKGLLRYFCSSNTIKVLTPKDFTFLNLFYLSNYFVQTTPDIMYEIYSTYFIEGPQTFGRQKVLYCINAVCVGIANMPYNKQVIVTASEEIEAPSNKVSYF